MVANLKFDFRGDLDQLPWLKSLPLRPSAVALGQLAAPVMILAACHVATLAAAAVAMPNLRVPLLAAALLAPPFDLLLLGVENLMFLLFPSRGPATPGELGAIGRQVVLFLLKVLTLAVACGVAGGLGAVVRALSHSPVAALSTTFCVLAIEGLSVVPLVALAYHRFDPSADTPP